jgi:hypothetical protein
MNSLKTALALEIWAHGLSRFDPDGFNVVSARHAGKPRSPYFFDLDVRNLPRNNSWYVLQDQLKEKMQRLMALELPRFHPICRWDFHTEVPNCGQLLPPGEVIYPLWKIDIGRWLQGEKKEDMKGLSFKIGYHPQFEFHRGQTVLVCEDVLNTGHSICKYVRFLRSLKGTCNHALILLDRQNGGREALEALDVEVATVFTVSEVFALWLEENLLPQETRVLVERELERLSKRAP